MQAPLHAIPLGQLLLELRLEGRFGKGIGFEIAFQPHKKCIRLFVDVLVEIDDISSFGMYESRYGTDDARSIGTMDEKGCLQIGILASKCRIIKRSEEKIDRPAAESLFIARKGAPPYLKGLPKTFYLLAQQIKVFQLLDTIFFKALAVRIDIAYHDIDVSGNFHPFMGTARVLGKGYFLWDENGIRQKRICNSVPMAIGSVEV